MARKQPPNWGEIRVLYEVEWLKPSEIADRYNVSAKTVTERASREKWRKVRQDSARNLLESESERRKRIVSKAGRIMEKVMDLLIDEYESGLRGTNVQDGEGHQDRYSAEFAKRAAEMYAKLDEDAEVEEEEHPGGLIGGVALDNI